MESSAKAGVNLMDLAKNYDSAIPLHCQMCLSAENEITPLRKAFRKEGHMIIRWDSLGESERHKVIHLRNNAVTTISSNLVGSEYFKRNVTDSAGFTTGNYLTAIKREVDYASLFELISARITPKLLTLIKEHMNSQRLHSMIISSSFLYLLEGVTYLKTDKLPEIKLENPAECKKANDDIVKVMKNPGNIVQKMRLLPHYIEEKIIGSKSLAYRKCFEPIPAIHLIGNDEQKELQQI